MFFLSSITWYSKKVWGTWCIPDRHSIIKVNISEPPIIIWDWMETVSLSCLNNQCNMSLLANRIGLHQPAPLYHNRSLHTVFKWSASSKLSSSSTRRSIQWKKKPLNPSPHSFWRVTWVLKSELLKLSKLVQLKTIVHLFVDYIISQVMASPWRDQTHKVIILQPNGRKLIITMKSRREKGGEIEGKVVNLTIVSPFDRQIFGWLNLFSGMGVDMQWLMVLLLSWDKLIHKHSTTW